MTDTFKGFGDILKQQERADEQKRVRTTEGNAIESAIADMFSSPQEKELRTYIAEVCKAEGIAPISVIFKQTKSSAANETTRSITLSNSIMKYDRHPDYKRSVALHEIAHFILYDNGDKEHAHNAKFQRVETILCRHYLGLIPIYPQERGYAIAFVNKDTKQIEFSWTGAKPDHPEFQISRERF